MERIAWDFSAKPTRKSSLSPRITADVIEANEFPELSQRFNVMGVPKTVINATQALVGAQPEARLMAAMGAAVSTTKEG